MLLKLEAFGDLTEAQMSPRTLLGWLAEFKTDKQLPQDMAPRFQKPETKQAKLSMRGDR